MPEDTFIAVLPPHRLGEIQGWRVTPAYQGYRLGARLLRAEGTAPPRGGLMMLGDTAVIVSNGEIFNQIGRRLKDRTPFRNTMMVTHAGAWLGYIRDDSGSGVYEQNAAQAVDQLVNRFINR